MTLTFRNLIVRARRRIHDLRDASALIITSYDQDGIRWSAVDLENNITEALIELSRDLVAYNIKGYMNTGVNYSILPGTLSTDGILSFEDDVKFYDIIRLEDMNSDVYNYVSPSKFFSEGYTDKLLDGTFVYTATKDISLNSMVYSIYPIPTATEFTLKAICSIDLKDKFNSANLEELPFFGIDDLILDYIERTCKIDEYDSQRVVELTAIIDKKMQILKANEARI